MGPIVRPAVVLLLVFIGAALIWSSLRWRARRRAAALWTYMDRSAFMSMFGIGVIALVAATRIAATGW